MSLIVIHVIQIAKLVLDQAKVIVINAMINHFY